MSLDEAALERAYHTLLSQFHPDRYAGKSAVEQRVVAQFCADVNSGYRTLLNEVTRAEYLLKSAGVDLQAAEREGVDADFLMMQIMLRERLEDMPASDTAERGALAEEIAGHYQASRDRCASAIAESVGQRRLGRGRKCAFCRSCWTPRAPRGTDDGIVANR